MVSYRFVIEESLSVGRRTHNGLGSVLGGYDDSIHASEVICENLDCPIYNADNTYYLTDEEAIEAWNRRVKNG